MDVVTHLPLPFQRLVVALAASCALAFGLSAQQPLPAPNPAIVSQVPFAEWLADLRKEAAQRGISDRTIELALTGIEPVPTIVERDRTQVEQTLSIDQYLKRRLNRATVKTARDMASRHADLLLRVSAAYKVPPGVIVAVWGLESNFGRFSGVRPTVSALATLAYDNRRAALFREELFNALRILDRGDIDLARMKGSWAGAMGQPQFLPSSYLQYAEDFDHDGKPDIWSSEADVFASIANYLAKKGWQGPAGWGRAVTVSKAVAAKIGAAAPLRTQGCEATRQMTEPLPLARWRALGVGPVGAQALPKSDTPASLVRAGSRDFLVFDNYHALLEYNCAHAYALAVGLLADQVRVTAPR